MTRELPDIKRRLDLPLYQQEANLLDQFRNRAHCVTWEAKFNQYPADEAVKEVLRFSEQCKRLSAEVQEDIRLCTPKELKNIDWS